MNFFTNLCATCSHSYSRHEFYTHTLHGCKETYYQPRGNT